MRNILKYITTLFLCATSASCDLLDRPLFDSLQYNDFYKTPDEINLGVIGTYGILSDLYVKNYVNYTELPGDNAHTLGETTNLSQLDKFSTTATNSMLENAWEQSFRCIASANRMIKAIPEVSFVTDEVPLQKQYLGEMHFLRALSYFNLVRLFGAVPFCDKITTIEEARKLTRTPAETIYEQIIISDLEKAMGLLPASYTGIDIGRATKWAAAGLLGKVYLTIHEYAMAEAVLAQVIASGKYSLLPTFADIFNPGNADHAESLFEVHFEKGVTGGSSWSFHAHNNNLASFFGISSAGATLPTQSIKVALESEGAARYNATIGKQGSYLYVKKHYLEHSYQNSSDDNWPLLRYADILLMYAEASNEITDAPSADVIEMVNMIRRRANGVAPTDVSNTTYNLASEETDTRNAFRDAVWKERRLELAFEGHRWFDLVRTGTYVSVMNRHFEEEFKGLYMLNSFNNLFPVPQYEIDINPNLAPNNPGYY